MKKNISACKKPKKVGLVNTDHFSLRKILSEEEIKSEKLKRVYEKSREKL